MASGRLTLTTRGAFAVGVAPSSAIAGFIVGAEELVLISVALFALLACGLAQCLYRANVARGQWQLTMHLPTSEVEAGQNLSMMAVLSASGSGGSVPTWLEDPLRNWYRLRRQSSPAPTRRILPNPSSARPIPRLLEGETVAIDCGPPTQRRGLFALRGVRHWCFDTAGLFAAVIGIGPTATITVYPKPVEALVQDDWLLGEEVHAATVADPIAGPARRQSTGDFAGLRPYVPGDRLRLLYWPALARSGDLVVRDFEDIVPNRVQLVVDVRSSLGDDGPEAALAVAAFVGLQVLARGTMLEFSTTAGDRVAIGPGTQGASALLRAIAAVELTSTQKTSRRQSAAPPPDELHVAPMTSTPLLITTTAGANDLPGSLGFGHVIVAA